MNRELEDLIVAYDHWRSAGNGPDAKRLKEIYLSRLEDAVSRHRTISQQALQRAVEYQHLQWVRAQKTPPSIPPKT